MNNNHKTGQNTAKHGPKRDYVDDRMEELYRAYPALDARCTEITARITRIAVYLERALSEVAAAQGLKLGEYLVLGALVRSGPPYALRPIELLKSLWITAGAVTKRIDRLIGMGLVKRESDPHDGRGAVIRLTPKGKALAERTSRSYPTRPEFQLAMRLPTATRNALTAGLHEYLLYLESAFALSSEPAKDVITNRTVRVRARSNPHSEE
jgi:DNA-binding MarR family transcriptional regulator